MFLGGTHSWSAPPPSVPDLATPLTETECNLLLRPITPPEVVARLSRMANTAPGPDGARYSGLRDASTRVAGFSPASSHCACRWSGCLSRGRNLARFSSTSRVLGRTEIIGVPLPSAIRWASSTLASHLSLLRIYECSISFYENNMRFYVI